MKQLGLSVLRRGIPRLYIESIKNKHSGTPVSAGL